MGFPGFSDESKLSALSRSERSVVVVLLLGLPHRGLEGIHVEFERLARGFDLVDGPADAHVWAHQVALELGKSAVVFGGGHGSFISSGSLGVQSWGPPYGGIKRQDFGVRLRRVREPEPRAQDSFPGVAATRFSSRGARAERELHARGKVDARGFGFATHL